MSTRSPSPRLSTPSLAHRAVIALAVLALASGCEREPEPAVPVPTGPTRAEIVDLGRAAAEVVSRRADGGWDRVEVPSRLDLLARLRLEGPIEELSREDTLVVSAVGRAGGRLRANLPPVLPTSLAAVELSYAGTSTGRVRLGWRGPDDEDFTRGLTYARVEGGGQFQRLRLPFAAPFVANDRVAEITLMLPADEVGVIRIHDVVLILDEPGRGRPVELDGQVRPAVACAVDQALQWEFTVPDGAVLHFDHAVHPAGWTTRGDGTWFGVEISDGGRVHEPWSRWLDPFANPSHRSWFKARVDLARWSGRRITLRLLSRSSAPARAPFNARADDRGDLPLFAAPRVIGSADGRPNVLLVVIDTLRKDGLGIYGNERDVSPHLDALAGESVVFDRAWAPSSWTHPSTASLLSGWVPSRHGLGMGDPGTTQIDPAAPWLPSSFQEAGWATAAVSNNVIVSPDEGFARGFDSFDTRAFEEDQIYGAQRVTTSALEWLEGHGEQPFFLYLHYFDPHDRYQAPPPFTRRFVERRFAARVDNLGILGGRPNPLREALVDPSVNVPVRPPDLAYLRALYDGEVSYVDHWIGRLLDGLAERGLRDDTLVVVTSDHGEEFFEHGYLKHGHSLYEELVGVPLMVRPPFGLAATTRIDAPVSLLDLPATLLALAGLDSAPFRGAGLDLSGLMENPRRQLQRSLVAENESRAGGEWSGHQRAALRWPWKLIENLDTERRALFDLQQDAAESHDLMAGAADEAAALVAVFDSLLVDPALAAVEDMPPDPALVEKLKAMGYVH